MGSVFINSVKSDLTAALPSIIQSAFSIGTKAVGAVVGAQHQRLAADVSKLAQDRLSALVTSNANSANLQADIAATKADLEDEAVALVESKIHFLPDSLIRTFAVAAVEDGWTQLLPFLEPPVQQVVLAAAPTLQIAGSVKGIPQQPK